MGVNIYWVRTVENLRHQRRSRIQGSVFSASFVANICQNEGKKYFLIIIILVNNMYVIINNKTVRCSIIFYWTLSTYVYLCFKSLVFYGSSIKAGTWNIPEHPGTSNNYDNYEKNM